MCLSGRIVTWTSSLDGRSWLAATTALTAVFAANLRSPARGTQAGKCLWRTKIGARSRGREVRDWLRGLRPATGVRGRSELDGHLRTGRASLSPRGCGVCGQPELGAHRVPRSQVLLEQRHVAHANLSGVRVGWLPGLQTTATVRDHRRSKGFLTSGGHDCRGAVAPCGCRTRLRASELRSCGAYCDRSPAS